MDANPVGITASASALTRREQGRTARVLVTGSSGFVGSHVASTLKKSGFGVVGLDLAPPIDSTGLDEFHTCDVTKRVLFAELIEAVRPDAVILAAAITPGEEETALAQAIYDVNLHSTLTGLMAAAAVGCRRVVYLSSAGVYTNPQPGTELTESSPVADTGGLYAQSKLASERLCIWASRELALTTTALRVGPVYGEFERPSGSRSRMSQTHRAIELVRNGEVIRCRHPRTLYNWIHGSDVGLAVASVLNATDPLPLYNLGGPAKSMEETLETLSRVLPEMRFEWTSDPDTENLPVSGVSRPLSSALLQNDLGFRPITDLNVGLEGILAARRKRAD